MSLEELFFKILTAILSIGAILLVLYYINKKALKKAERMNEEIKRMNKDQEDASKQEQINKNKQTKLSK